MNRLAIGLVSALCAAAWAEPKPVKNASPAAPPLPAKQDDSGKPLVAFPAPLMTEVLYAVPTGEQGDANKDGTRQVSGDEFVELVNPHDRAIDLAGYTLTDKAASEKTTAGKPKASGIRWTFPACTLKPGQVVVVFNGYNSTFDGPVGDSMAAPAKGNDKFGGALVFTMRNTGERTSFSNATDWVLLSGPDGRAVQLIKWGDVGKTPEGVPLVESAPAATRSSIQRAGLRGALASHPVVNGVSFSPGVFETGIKPALQPLPKPTEPSKMIVPTIPPTPLAPTEPDKKDDKPPEAPATPPVKPKW